MLANLLAALAARPAPARQRNTFMWRLMLALAARPPASHDKPAKNPHEDLREAAPHPSTAVRIQQVPPRLAVTNSSARRRFGREAIDPAELLTLRRGDLTEMDLTGAYWGGADLTGANLAKANLSRANLMCANLTDVDLTDANLADADLSEVTLIRTRLVRTNLIGALLVYAKLIDVDASGANLTGAHLFQALLVNVTWSQKTIWPAEYAESIMEGSTETSRGVYVYGGNVDDLSDAATT